MYRRSVIGSSVAIVLADNPEPRPFSSGVDNYQRDATVFPRQRIGWNNGNAGGAEFGLAGTVHHATHHRNFGRGLSPVAVCLPRADPLRQRAAWLIETIAEPP
jgi:hypothetical protein